MCIKIAIISNSVSIRVSTFSESEVIPMPEIMRKITRDFKNENNIQQNLRSRPSIKYGTCNV